MQHGTVCHEAVIVCIYHDILHLGVACYKLQLCCMEAVLLQISNYVLTEIKVIPGSSANYCRLILMYNLITCLGILHGSYLTTREWYVSTSTHVYLSAHTITWWQYHATSYSLINVSQVLVCTCMSDDMSHSSHIYLKHWLHLAKYKIYNLRVDFFHPQHYSHIFWSCSHIHCPHNYILLENITIS